MIKIFTFILITIGIAGCAAEPYKKADLSWYGGATGYLEKELKPGIYILEYSQIGGYNYNLELNKTYWLKRAKELCPAGYDGGYEVIHPAHAKIPEFECSRRYCTSYPLVSGIIKCKNYPTAKLKSNWILGVR
jgi:hypothetical protein